MRKCSVVWVWYVIRCYYESREVKIKKQHFCCKDGWTATKLVIKRGFFTSLLVLFKDSTWLLSYLFVLVAKTGSLVFHPLLRWEINKEARFRKCFTKKDTKTDYITDAKKFWILLESPATSSFICKLIRHNIHSGKGPLKNCFSVFVFS